MPIAYKVVKRKLNGARVSVMLPSWHPCFKVYMRNGEIQTVNDGMVFNNLESAKFWVKEQLGSYDWIICCELKDGETLEVWEAEYDKKNFALYVFAVADFVQKDLWSKSNKRELKKIFNNMCYPDMFKKVQNSTVKSELLRNTEMLPAVNSVTNIRLIKKLA